MQYVSQHGYSGVEVSIVNKKVMSLLFIELWTVFLVFGSSSAGGVSATVSYQGCVPSCLQ